MKCSLRYFLSTLFCILNRHTNQMFMCYIWRWKWRCVFNVGFVFIIADNERRKCVAVFINRNKRSNSNSIKWRHYQYRNCSDLLPFICMGDINTSMYHICFTTLQKYFTSIWIVVLNTDKQILAFICYASMRQFARCLKFMGLEFFLTWTWFVL